VFVLFFFQAEDGIRDFHVTGVQTCALPIWLGGPQARDHRHLPGGRLRNRLGARIRTLAEPQPAAVDDEQRAVLEPQRHELFESRSEEHTSELQSREISYAVFCLKKQNK